MTDVLFDASEPEPVEDPLQKKEDVDGVEVSADILGKYRDFFNNLQFKTLVGLYNYHTAHSQYPTYKELAEFMDVDKNNIQPRLNELRNGHAVIVTGKRRCSVSSHDRKVSVFKPVVNIETEAR